LREGVATSGDSISTTGLVKITCPSQDSFFTSLSPWFWHEYPFTASQFAWLGGCVNGVTLTLVVPHLQVQ
jgi:hypothetical protein